MAAVWWLEQQQLLGGNGCQGGFHAPSNDSLPPSWKREQESGDYHNRVVCGLVEAR